jgi:hypothetical protein
MLVFFRSVHLRRQVGFNLTATTGSSAQAVAVCRYSRIATASLYAICVPRVTFWTQR